MALTVNVVAQVTRTDTYATGDPIQIRLPLGVAAPAGGSLAICITSILGTGAASPGSFGHNFSLPAHGGTAAPTDSAGNTYQELFFGSIGQSYLLYCENNLGLAAGDEIAWDLGTWGSIFTTEVGLAAVVVHVQGAPDEVGDDIDLMPADFGSPVVSNLAAVGAQAGQAALFFGVWGYRVNAGGWPITDDDASHSYSGFPAASQPITELVNNAGVGVGGSSGFGTAITAAVQLSDTPTNGPDVVTIDGHNGGTVFGDLVVWAIAFGGAPTGTGPFCLQTRGGQYHIAYADAGFIRYRRCELTTPPFVTLATVTGGGADSEPRMCEEDNPAGRIRLVFSRTGAVRMTLSDDDGETFASPPVTLWSSPAKRPTVAYDPQSGYTLYAAYVSGHLEGRLQGPGQSLPDAAFTLTGIAAVDDAAFHIAPAEDAEGRWLLVLLDGGVVKNYVSTDDGQSWVAA